MILLNWTFFKMLKRIFANVLRALSMDWCNKQYF